MDDDLRACLNGDKRAWDAFVDRWSGVIYASVLGTLGSRAGDAASSDIEDVAQNVFVRLVKDNYRLLSTYDETRSSLSTWLTLVARSVTIDCCRKRRLPTVPLDSRSDGATTELTEQKQLPQIPMHLLTSRQRLVLRMLFDEGMSVAEAAGIIRVNQQTIRSTKHKALSRLREFLSPT